MKIPKSIEGNIREICGWVYDVGNTASLIETENSLAKKEKEVKEKRAELLATVKPEVDRLIQVHETLKPKMLPKYIESFAINPAAPIPLFYTFDSQGKKVLTNYLTNKAEEAASGYGTHVLTTPQQQVNRYKMLLEFVFVEAMVEQQEWELKAGVPTERQPNTVAEAQDRTGRLLYIPSKITLWNKYGMEAGISFNRFSWKRIGKNLTDKYLEEVTGVRAVFGSKEWEDGLRLVISEEGKTKKRGVIKNGKRNV